MLSAANKLPHKKHCGRHKACLFLLKVNPYLMQFVDGFEDEGISRNLLFDANLMSFYQLCNYIIIPIILL